MTKETDLKRLYYDLPATSPIKAIYNKHLAETDSWFDMHYEIEVGIVIKGKMRRHYPGHTMDLEPGDVWFCGTWEPHGFEIQLAACEVLVLVVDPEFILKNNYFDFDIFSVFHVEPKARPNLATCNKQKILAIANKAKDRLFPRCNPNWAKQIFFELMLVVLEEWEPPSKSNSSMPVTKGIQSALQLVYSQKNLISTFDAAAACHMSVSKFRIEFKELMGTPFSDFALKFRVKAAHHDLKTSNGTQEQIAIEWGFTDASHLHRHLKKMV